MGIHLYTTLIVLRYRHSVSNFGGTFHQEGTLNFVKTFSSSIKRINWFLFFSLLIYYIYWFACCTHPLSLRWKQLEHDLWSYCVLEVNLQVFSLRIFVCALIREIGLYYSSLLFYLPVAHSLFPRTVLDLKNAFGCVLYFLLCGIVCSESICIRSPLKVC